MGSNGREAKSDDELSEIMLEAESFLTRLLTTNPPAPSDPIVRKLNANEIQSMQHLIMPDDHPQDISSVLQQAMTVFDKRMRLNHPQCFSYTPACPNPIARLGDLLTSVCNVNAVTWDVSSGPSAVEKSHDKLAGCPAWTARLSRRVLCLGWLYGKHGSHNCSPR